MRTNTIRDVGIDSLRGLVILLIVLYHVEGKRFGVNLPVVRLLNQSLFMIRLPLFSAIAGYVYAMRPQVPVPLFEFISDKARRILIPMVCVATLSVLFLEASPGEFDSWHALVFPYRQLWFLQALFVVFGVVTVLEPLGFLQSVWGWLFMTIGVGVYVLVMPSPFKTLALFSFNRGPYILFFFLIGLGLSRHFEIFPNGSSLNWVVALFVIGLGLHVGGLLDCWACPMDRTNLLGLVLGSSAVVLGVKYRKPVKWLASIGGVSYSIYLFHWSMADLVDMGLTSGRIELPPMIEFMVLFFAGVIGSIVAHGVFSRGWVTRVLFLGKRRQESHFGG